MIRKISSKMRNGTRVYVNSDKKTPKKKDVPRICLNIVEAII